MHNDEEVRHLQRRGLRIIDYEQLAVLRNETVR
jgi:4-hydroxy-3-methylbut-2-enyl diphosphate reductase